jgi:hypothetical protein
MRKLFVDAFAAKVFEDLIVSSKQLTRAESKGNSERAAGNGETHANPQSGQPARQHEVSALQARVA